MFGAILLCAMNKSNPFPSKRRAGFTLVEIMIVVVIIGLLAALATQSYMKVQEQSHVSRAANDLRVFAEGFERYALENGQWPADGTPNSIPAGMSGYFADVTWQSGTSLGGVYDWDQGVFGVTASVSIVSATASRPALVKLDALIDDGDLSSGRLRELFAGRLAFILEE